MANSKNPFLSGDEAVPTPADGVHAEVTGLPPAARTAGSRVALEKALRSRAESYAKRLGQLLLEAGLVSQAQLDEALSRQAALPGQRLGVVLEGMGAATAETVASTLARKFGVPFVKLANFDVEPEALARVPRQIAQRYGVLPLMLHNTRLVVAMEDATDSHTLDMIRFAAGAHVEVAFATARDLRQAIARHYGVDDHAEALQQMADSGGAAVDPQSQDDFEQLSRQKPIVRLVDGILWDALEQRASDIHIQPESADASLVFRVDGTLRRIRTINKSLLPGVVSRLKVLGKMDIAERRLPQDGRARVVTGDNTADLRISVMPTVKGESVVIRILASSDRIVGVEELGLSEHDQRVFLELSHRNNGLLLVTGPTGSGKSTTLNAVLQDLRQRNLKIVTVEDPVEIQMADVDQIQVNEGVGYTFPRALRQILRHDPDVIMVGEIRDRETAQIAVESALTGHLVLSTLHTNNAAATVARLVDMGIEPYLVATTLLGVLAQRLVRRNCVHCMREESVDASVRKNLGVPADEIFYRGEGCPRCAGTGYAGRMAVHELLVMTPAMRAWIKPGVSADDMASEAKRQGMVPLAENALRAARQRLTSLAEVYRVRLD